MWVWALRGNIIDYILETFKNARASADESTPRPVASRGFRFLLVLSFGDLFAGRQNKNRRKLRGGLKSKLINRRGVKVFRVKFGFADLCRLFSQ